MTESERIFDALRNCVTIPKCRDCPWAECEIFNHEKVEIPKDLALAVLRELAAQEQNKSGSGITLNEYQMLAQRTARKDLCPYDHVFNGVLGLCGEAGECADLLKKSAYQDGRDIKQDMKEELGDCLWYCAELAAGMGWMLEEVGQENIDKLKRRYPEGFDLDKSLHRGGENDNG